ncbi:short chain dehydrogenase [Colletotrichum orchidophilum]|uniref:Short chain dehydrogenase n=1 Tax=Colletotrichum orchidophilum TaxID=1209926 RepID=A0A1G4BBF2_9PEZI|nr:short chain dehydrogenase [Colletotrichum orchidophilum]OHE98666.1 short chain dehydrogenase [Colletotrichum orchidophilum]
MSQTLHANAPSWDVFNVTGLVAVITGGGSGLGLMFAKALEANGAAKVYIIGRNWQKLEAASKQAKYGNIIPLPGDVTSKESLKESVDYITAREGYINLLVLCAGRSGPGMGDDKSGLTTLEDNQRYLLSLDMDDWTNTYHVNVTASFYTAISFLLLLDAGNKQRNFPVQSQVISMSSVGGYCRGLFGSFAYAISKTGVRQITQSLATHFAPWQIRFNALALGGFRSELTEQMALFKLTDPKAEDDGSVPASRATVLRAGREVEAAGAMLYLASLAGGYTNGTVILADGGSASVVPSTYG